MDQQSSFPAPPAEQAPEPLPARRRPRRAIAALATTALVAAVAGVGAGYVAGHGFGGSTTTAAGSAQRSTTYGDGTTGQAGTQALPGWTWSTPDQGTLPTNPFGSDGTPDGQGRSSTSGSTTKASASQLTGLVRITSTMKYAGAKAAGTGMVLTSVGEVVTNHHVVEGATSVKATVMSTGKTYVAAVVGTDAKDDVAVLQLSNASGLSTVQTDTSTVAVGDAVTAVGDANGTVGYLSAAKGRVMALNRSITTRDEGTATGERLTSLIKLSSDVMSGDSGGATYDSSGDVIGMTTAASSGSSNVVGYTVPISTVLSVADDLENNVTSSRYTYGYPAFLGVGLGQTGTTVQGVYQGTPAARAGIVAGDTITAVDRTSVSTAKGLHALIGTHSVGGSAALTWTDRSGASHTATVTLVQGAVE